jgi:mRNA-degrading endonuclease HigB of HigAB toxin-antitoxin module
MVIINRHILLEFTRKHADTGKPVVKWIADVENAQWSSFIDVKKHIEQPIT